MNRRKHIILSLLATICGGAMAQDDDLADLMASVYAAQLHKDSIDKSQMVATYRYECRTTDADGQPVTDRLDLALQIGAHSTRCYPLWKYREQTLGIDWDMRTLYEASFVFMPEVWTNYPDGQVTVRDHIVPNIYETRDKREEIAWTLSDDTTAVGGYPCKTATAQLHGKQWTVSYTEEISTMAGPWKLGGLPGLIVEAHDADGIHSFTIESVEAIATPIYYEHNAITNIVPSKKLIKQRNQIFGNKQYPRNPIYYLPDRKTGYGKADITFGELDGEIFEIVNNVVVKEKAHVYQPLEQE